jgi:hypothetical protein
VSIASASERAIRRNKKFAGSTRTQLIEEVAALHKTLDMERHYTIDEWEASMPQHVRDEFAARALIVTYGSMFRALAMLGFPEVAKYHAKDFREIAERIFGTPGVQAILKRDLAKPEEYRAQLISRQIEIALYEDPDRSTRAFTVLAKVCGWQKTPDVLVQNNRATILALVAQQHPTAAPAPEREALPKFLDHEPGAAVRIDSDSELIDAALEGEI